MFNQGRQHIQNSLGKYSGYLEDQVFAEFTKMQPFQNKKALNSQNEINNTKKNVFLRKIFKNKRSATTLQIINTQQTQQRPIQLKLQQQQSMPKHFLIFRNVRRQFCTLDTDKFIIRRKSCQGELYGEVKKEKTLLQSVKYEIAQHRKTRLKLLLRNLIKKSQQAKQTQILEQEKEIGEQFCATGYKKESSLIRSGKFLSKDQNRVRSSSNIKFPPKKIIMNVGFSPKVSKIGLEHDQEIQRIKIELQEFKLHIERTSHFRKQQQEDLRDTSILSNLSVEPEQHQQIVIMDPLKLIKSPRNLAQYFGSHRVIPKITSLRMIEIKQPLLNLNSPTKNEIATPRSQFSYNLEQSIRVKTEQTSNGKNYPNMIPFNKKDIPKPQFSKRRVDNLIFSMIKPPCSIQSLNNRRLSELNNMIPFLEVDFDTKINTNKMKPLHPKVIPKDYPRVSSHSLSKKMTSLVRIKI